MQDFGVDAVRRHGALWKHLDGSLATRLRTPGAAVYLVDPEKIALRPPQTA